MREKYKNRKVYSGKTNKSDCFQGKINNLKPQINKFFILVVTAWGQLI